MLPSALLPSSLLMQSRFAALPRQISLTISVFSRQLLSAAADTPDSRMPRYAAASFGVASVDVAAAAV